MRRLTGIPVVAGLVLALSSSGAWAFKCPSLAKQARELLSSTSTNTDKYAKAKTLIEKGEEQHKAAQRNDSAATLEEALKVLRTP
jgi:hypothetical protein